MGLTMHSPGGVPGTSPAHMLGTEPWGSVHDVPLGAYIVVGGASLALGGPLGRIARPAAGWLGRQLVLKPINKVQGGFTNPITAYGSISEVNAWLTRYKIGSGIYDIVDGSSSHGLVQNGGPSAPPPLVQSGQLSDILSLGKISRPQSAHGRSPRASAARRQRWCPARKWGRPCLLREGHKGPHHFQSNPE